MAASPEGRSSFSFLLICTAAFIMLSSCSSEKVLVLTDPGFDYFASRNMSFYNFRRELIFRLNGFNPDFIPYSPNDSYEKQIDSLLDGSVYGSVVTGVAPFYRIEIPEDINTVLMGGAPELASHLSARVVSTAIPALYEAGAYMKERYLEDGMEGLVIIYDDQEDVKKAFLDGWDQDGNKTETHILEINRGEGEVREVMASFLDNYDLEEDKYLLLAYCAPVMQDLFESLPVTDNTALILEMPDDSLYPVEPEALIQYDYKGLLSAAAGVLKEGDAGGIRKVPYLFQKK